MVLVCLLGEGGLVKRLVDFVDQLRLLLIRLERQGLCLWRVAW